MKTYKCEICGAIHKSQRGSRKTQDGAICGAPWKGDKKFKCKGVIKEIK